MSDAEVESHIGVVLQLSGVKSRDGGTATKQFINQRRKKSKL